MKKRITGVILAIAIIIGGSVVLAYTMNAARNNVDNELTANPQSGSKPGAVNDIHVIKDPNMGALNGENGSTLWVSNQDYAEMMRILYPNGVLDEQGLEIGGVDNLEEHRAQFIAEHTKAFTFDGDEVVAVETVPFNISIEGFSNGEYSCQFYQAQIGEDYFVFPSEWGDGQPCGFVAADKAGVYLAYTDVGIWRINPKTLTTQKLTSDTYAGKNREELIVQSKGYLYWVDGVQISPDGSYAVYRTNRDCEDSSDTSAWLIDLLTGEESRIIEPARNNDFIGFVSESHFMVGALANTRIVDITTGEVISVSFPELPNFYINNVDKGMIVYSSYVDGTSDTVMYISRIDTSTGSMTLITKLIGYVHEPQFSPSGRMLAIGYGTDPMAGTKDVILVDLAAGTQNLLTASVENADQIDGWIRNHQWASNDTLIITAQNGNVCRTYFVAFER